METKSRRFRVVGIGEVLWDLFAGGKQLGGAPANFAYHGAALGAEAQVISRVGEDDLGKALLERLEQLGLPKDTIEIDPAAPTGTVSVTLSELGQPFYVIHEDVAWDSLAGEEPCEVAVAQADAVCFGTLAQRAERSRSTIRRLVQETSGQALRVCDVNLRQNYYTPEIIADSLALANVLKVNDGELPILAEIFSLKGDEREQISELAVRHRLKAVACTRGKQGSLLFLEGRWSDHPGLQVDVVDTVGAGDSFTAAMVLGLLAGWDLDKVNLHANRVAAYVASCSGATPRLPNELCMPFLMNETKAQGTQV